MQTKLRMANIIVTEIDFLMERHTYCVFAPFDIQIYCWVDKGYMLHIRLIGQPFFALKNNPEYPRKTYLWWNLALGEITNIIRNSGRIGGYSFLQDITTI